jgi:hypothetical protein
MSPGAVGFGIRTLLRYSKGNAISARQLNVLCRRAVEGASQKRCGGFCIVYWQAKEIARVVNTPSRRAAASILAAWSRSAPNRVEASTNSSQSCLGAISSLPMSLLTNGASMWRLFARKGRKDKLLLGRCPRCGEGQIKIRNKWGHLQDRTFTTTTPCAAPVAIRSGDTEILTIPVRLSGMLTGRIATAHTIRTISGAGYFPPMPDRAEPWIVPASSQKPKTDTEKICRQIWLLHGLANIS